MYPLSMTSSDGLLGLVPMAISGQNRSIFFLVDLNAGNHPLHTRLPSGHMNVVDWDLEFSCPDVRMDEIVPV